MIATKWFHNTEEIEDAKNIREEVFVKEQNVPYDIEMDGLDYSAYHVVAYDGEKPAATGRMIIENGEFIVGRVAVLKKYRGEGYGDLVVRMLVRKCFNLGAKEVKIHAQLQAQKFYEKIGFQAFGEVFDEAGIQHINMVCKEDVHGNCH